MGGGEIAWIAKNLSASQEGLFHEVFSVSLLVLHKSAGKIL